jgi:hypothetical protein
VQSYYGKSFLCIFWLTIYLFSAGSLRSGKSVQREQDGKLKIFAGGNRKYWATISISDDIPRSQGKNFCALVENCIDIRGNRCSVHLNFWMQLLEPNDKFKDFCEIGRSTKVVFSLRTLLAGPNSRALIKIKNAVRIKQKAIAKCPLLISRDALTKHHKF